MSAKKATEQLPPLPPGPVDHDKLSAALAAGKSGEEAVEAATKNNPTPQEVAPDENAPIVADPETPAKPAVPAEKE